MKVALDGCRKRLATLWFAGAGFFLGILILQTLLGHFAGQEKAAWSWALPTVMPTLSLMLGVFVATSTTASGERMVESYSFRLAFLLSLAYLTLILLPVLIQPLTSSGPIEILETSNFFLGPIQGLVSLSLGAFFVRSGKQ